MYIPKDFKENNQSNLNNMIEKYPFSTLVALTATGIEANHIPLFLQTFENKTVLQGHIAKANPLWKKVKENSEVLITFNGPNCYLSPNYYPTKKENGRAVPTWNYVSVHVKGILNFVQNNDWKIAMLNNLTDQHEARQKEPWSVNDAPQAYIEKMLSAIVGIEIDVLSMEGKWKVSQNQLDKNKLGVISGLSQETESNARKIANLVQESMGITN